jgi:hypothetical protein
MLLMRAESRQLYLSGRLVLSCPNPQCPTDGSIVYPLVAENAAAIPVVIPCGLCGGATEGVAFIADHKDGQTRGRE